MVPEISKQWNLLAIKLSRIQLIIQQVIFKKKLNTTGYYIIYTDKEIHVEKCTSRLLAGKES
jgi:hypothetical protein